MSWLQKLLPPKIKRSAGTVKKAVPEGLWSKCEICETVLYRADLDKNLNVCPKCGHHNRITARERIEPPRNRNSNAATTSGTYLMDPCTTTSASSSSVSALAA